MTMTEEFILCGAKTAFEERGVQRQFTAQNLNMALRQYENSCMKCSMMRDCVGGACSIEKAFLHNTKKFQKEMENPFIRQKVELALELA